MRTPFLWLYIGKSGPLQAHHVLRAATPFVLGAHLALAAVWFAKPLLPQQHVVAMAGAVVLSYVITILVSLCFAAGREALREALKLVPMRAPAAVPSESKITCRTLDVDPRPSTMHYRSISDMNDAIVSNLHRLPRDIDLVVGVPRSGILAATLVSLAANIPMTDLDSFIAGKIYYSGITKRRAALDRQASDMRKILVIDDSVSGGNAMRDARNRIEAAGIKADFIFAAVFGLQPQHQETDVVLEVVPHPQDVPVEFHAPQIPRAKLRRYRRRALPRSDRGGKRRRPGL